jgi:hypothetical protein
MFARPRFKAVVEVDLRSDPTAAFLAAAQRLNVVRWPHDSRICFGGTSVCPLISCAFSTDTMYFGTVHAPPWLVGLVFSASLLLIYSSVSPMDGVGGSLASVTLAQSTRHRQTTIVILAFLAICIFPSFAPSNTASRRHRLIRPVREHYSVAASSLFGCFTVALRSRI